MPVFDRLLSAVVITAGTVILALMILQISLDAFLRTLFSTPLPATVEIVSNYYMVALSFLPIALAERRGRQIEATFIYDALPRPLKVAARMLARGLGVVIYALLTWQTTLDALTKTRIHAYVIAGSHQVPIWPGYWLMPLSFGLLVIALLLPAAGPDPARQKGA